MGELLGMKLKHGSFDCERGDYPITLVLHRFAERDALCLASAPSAHSG